MSSKKETKGFSELIEPLQYFWYFAVQHLVVGKLRDVGWSRIKHYTCVYTDTKGRDTFFERKEYISRGRLAVDHTITSYPLDSEVPDTKIEIRNYNNAKIQLGKELQISDIIDMLQRKKRR